jgi:hypothetical protein
MQRQSRQRASTAATDAMGSLKLSKIAIGPSESEHAKQILTGANSNGNVKLVAGNPPNDGIR